MSTAPHARGGVWVVVGCSRLRICTASGDGGSVSFTPKAAAGSRKAVAQTYEDLSDVNNTTRPSLDA